MTPARLAAKRDAYLRLRDWYKYIDAIMDTSVWSMWPYRSVLVHELRKTGATYREISDCIGFESATASFKSEQGYHRAEDQIPIMEAKAVLAAVRCKVRGKPDWKRPSRRKDQT